MHLFKNRLLFILSTSVAKEGRKKKCAEMTARIIRKIRPMIQGIHLMPLGWTDIVPDILNQAGIKPVQAT